MASNGTIAMNYLTAINTSPHEFSPAPITPEEGAAGFRAVANIFAKWGLSEAQAATLLDMSKSTYHRWRMDGPGKVSRDLAMRLGFLLGIHKGLRLLFRDPSRAYAWVKKPNDAFDGQSALDVMLNGYLTDLMRVRTYLDNERGGW